jgi:hypothetical protein
MNKSYSKIRHIQNSNILLESRTKSQFLINEKSRPNVVTPDYDYIIARDDKTKDICNNVKRVKNKDEDNIILNIYDALNNQWQFDPKIASSNYISASGTEKLKTNLKQLKNKNEYCSVVDGYKNKYKRDLDKDANWAFWKNESWSNNFFNIIPNSSTPSSDSQTKKGVGWEQYPCVVNDVNSKKVTSLAGQVFYDVDGFYHYDTGKRMNKQTNEISNYYCEDYNTRVGGTKPLKSDTSTPATQETTTQQPVANTNWSTLPTKVSTIQKSLNITPSGKMDQTTINTIMTKLGGNNVTNVEKKEPSQTGTSTSSEA